MKLMKNPPALLVLLLLSLTGLRCSLNAGQAPIATPSPQVYADSFFSGRAYQDSNNNQALDPGDAPLAGAIYIVEGWRSTTDKSGHATVIIPGGWDKPVTARMLPPPDSNAILIGPAEVTLQSPDRTSADFLFTLDSRTPSAQAPALIATADAAPAAQATAGAVDIDLTYCITPEGVELKMDVYYPEKFTATAPAILYIHGGAWRSGDKSDGAGLIFTPLLRRSGYVIVAINYRLAPTYKFPAQIEDVRCALRHLRANAERYHIDPQRIGTMGGSAGGHLAALLGLMDATPTWPEQAYVEEYANQPTDVQAVVDMFGPIDLRAMVRNDLTALGRQVFGVESLEDPRLQLYNPLTYIDPNDPPFLILHGLEDDSVPPAQSQLLYDQLTAAGVPAELVLVENAGHGFRPVNGDPQPTLAELARLVVNFFDQSLRP